MTDPAATNNISQIAVIGGGHMSLRFLEFSNKVINYSKYAFYMCECGNIIEARCSHVKAGQKSCGCKNSPPPINIVHGLYGTPEYVSWGSMMTRCYKKNNKSYGRYGGRGILVCDEWHNPSEFCRWARENGCRKGLQLERKDNNKGYSPDNCIFVPPAINAKNRSRTYWWHTPKGVFPTLKDASEAYGVWIASRFDRVDMPEYFKVKKYEDD